MKQIFKYRLTPDDINEIMLPIGAKVLCVQTQREEPHIWALVDNEQPEAVYRFRVIGTGHNFPTADDFDYIGTFQLLQGSLVYHVFEQKPGL